MCDRKPGPPPPKRLRISELNPHLLCALCGGYLIDATTIIECLHSFCKTCILRYLETSNYCPICEVLIHKTRPWQNIRLDHSLQNAVYKMVPGLFQNEMRRRREFYEKQNLHDKRGRPSNQPQGELGDRIIFSQDEEFSISIEFSPDGKPVKELKEGKTKSLKRPKGKCLPDKRYLKCPAGLRIEHLKKFIRSKFTLPQTVEIDLFYETETLSETFSLMDVAYIYSWKRDCVLRLFYSFYEIPSKLRKLEAVTKVTEVSESKVKDNTEEKADKRNNDKMPKGKREKTREKRQSKLSGKRKVSSDGAAACSSRVSKTDQVVAAEVSAVDSIVKCKVPETESVSSSQNVKPVINTTSSNVDKHGSSTSIPERCSNISHTIFQSPTKQKPPPENTSYSIISHSSNKDIIRPSKGQDSKASIKLLIKSSDIKDGKTQNGEATPERYDRKWQSGEAPTNAKIRKCHNGETQPTSKSNLFEKMDTFARLSQPEFRECTSISDSYSSAIQNLPNNLKILKESDVKCDVKSGVNITRPNSTIVVNQVLDNLTPERLPAAEIVRNEKAESHSLCVSTDEAADIKPRMPIVSSSIEKVAKYDVAVKDRSASETKPVDKPTQNVNKNSFDSTNGEQISKPEEHGIKASETKKVKLNEVQTNAHNFRQQDGFCYTIQDANQNEAKLERMDDVTSLNGNEQNISEHVPYDMKISVVQTENSSITKNTVEPKLRCDETRQNRSKPVQTAAKLVTHNQKQKSVKQVQDGNKQRGVDAKQLPSQIKSTNNPNLTTSPRTNFVGPCTNVGAQKIQNSSGKVAETNIGLINTVTTNKPTQQDSAVSKVVTGTTDSNGPKRNQDLHKKTVTQQVKTESQQLAHPGQDMAHSLQSSNTPLPLSKPVTSISITTPKVTSAESNVRVSSSQVIISQGKPPSNISPLISSTTQPLTSDVCTTATLLSPLSAPPKLMKTPTVDITSSSSSLPTSYSIASMVSVARATGSNTPASSIIKKSLAQSTSTTTVASSTADLSRSCDVTSSVSARTSLTWSSTSAFTKTTLAVPLTPAASSSSSASSLTSREKELAIVSVKQKDTESSPASLAAQVKLPDTTSSPSDTPSRITTSACVSSKASMDKAPTTTAPTIALSVSTPPSTSSVATSLAAPTNVMVSVAATNTDTWITGTTVNVANTFLHMPLTESSVVKDAQAMNGARAVTVSSSGMMKPKEALKLDNFLFDTKSVETDSTTTVSNHKVKDSCTVVKQGQKSLLRTKPNSSAQPHGLTNDKSSKNTASHITAIHNLPKTISQTSKPYSVARSMSVSSTSTNKCNNIIQTTKISTLIPKSSSITSKAGLFSKSFSYPSAINNVPSSRSFLHTSLASQLSRSEMTAVMNRSSGYERAMMTKTSALPSSFSLQTSSHATSSSHHRTSSYTKHSSKDGDNKLEKSQKNKAIPPLTIPKSCLVGTTLKLQRSPGSTDHYIFAPLNHYGPTAHHNGERSKNKESKHNGSRAPTSPITPTEDSMVVGERQRVPTIKISDINRNPIIVESGGSGNGGINSTRHNSPYRSYNHGSSRSSSLENGPARTHSRGGSDSSSPTGSSDKSDRSPARDARRPSDSELLMSQHWHGYSAADLLFNGFKLPTHPKFHDLHYDTDAMPLDYSQSSSKS